MLNARRSRTACGQLYRQSDSCDGHAIDHNDRNSRRAQRVDPTRYHYAHPTAASDTAKIISADLVTSTAKFA
jgi:hypothetical protein